MFLPTPPPPAPPQEIPVTVWIHGTRPSAFLPGLQNEVKEQLDTSAHAPYGLHSAQNLDPSLKHYKITKKLSQANPQEFPFEHIYVFGWNGDLDITVRQGAAFDLYHQLVELKKWYQHHYQRTPRITIITHSHGGNVALELAALYKEEDLLEIQRLMLLACPAQKATAFYTTHAMFKQIYAVHSYLDMVQIMDPQRLQPLKKAFQLLIQEKTFNGFFNVQQQMQEYPLFSERYFPLQEKLTHVEVAWKDETAAWSPDDIDAFGPAGTLIKKIAQPLRKKHRGVLHTEFESPTFIQKIPTLFEQIETRKLSFRPTVQKPDLSIEI